MTCIRPYLWIPLCFPKTFKDAVIYSLYTVANPTLQTQKELHVDQLQVFFLYFKMNSLILEQKLNFKMTDKM